MSRNVRVADGYATYSEHGGALILTAGLMVEARQSRHARNEKDTR